MPPLRPNRLPLGRTSRRLPFERRVRLWLIILGLPALLLLATLTWQQSKSLTLSVTAVLLLALAWLVACSVFFDQLIRPLQTLANVVASLREDDFSFRARGGRRGDALGDLAFEVNALAATLQQQRNSARDALTLVERVLTSMQSPVLAFDGTGHLRLLNQAAHTLLLNPGQPDPTGQHAFALGLSTLFETADQGLFLPPAPTASRWSVRRTTFRLDGLPHVLLVLTDVAAALREEERSAWQRLIRVLSHEINNSLTPIKSIAGSLRTRLIQQPDTLAHSDDLNRGLTVIEDRSASLNRFLQAYQRLTRLPPPVFRPVSIETLIKQVVLLETRLLAGIHPGPPLTVFCDPDQIQQALINLLQNAADAALSHQAEAQNEPQIRISWTRQEDQIAIEIEDNGPGINNPANLFVPFYTTKVSGSGIGLVLTQQIASAHHGSVTLTPGSHLATCARLVLPLQIGP